MKKFNFLFIAVCVIVALAPAMSQAMSLVGTTYTTGSGRNVTVQFNDESKSTWGVEFRTKVRDENGDLLNGGEWFEGFCIELGQSAKTGSEHLVDLVAPSLVDGGLHAAWLMENREMYQQDHAAWSSYEITGLQLAIWEVTHNYSSNLDYSLNAGAFKVSKAATQARQLADFYLDSLASFFDPIGLDNKYQISQSPEYQNFILNIPTDPGTAPVPEPGTLLLVGSGLLGGMALLRKRRS
jgi:hypothetical protein